MKKDALTSAFLDIRGKLHRMAVRLLHDDEEAKDVVQDSFVKLWSHGVSVSDAEARNKLVCVLRNTCIDHLRTRHTVSLDAVDARIDCGYVTSTEDMAEYERLITCGLSDLQLRIYDMVTHECREYDEIAGILGMSVEAVRMNMCRCRKRISMNIKSIDR